MIALIVANGVLTAPDNLADLISQADLIIAADGGANHCFQVGITPDLIIGDFDSIKPAILLQHQKEGMEILRHSPQKNATDLELALDQALSRGAESVWILGALGGRWDMSLANILLLAQEKYQALRVTIFDQNSRMSICYSGRPWVVYGTPGETVSLLPLGGDVEGLTLDGFLYPLHEATLHLGTTRGISNILQQKEGTILLHKGVILCILSTG